MYACGWQQATVLASSIGQSVTSGIDWNKIMPCAFTFAPCTNTNAHLTKICAIFLPYCLSLQRINQYNKEQMNAKITCIGIYHPQQKVYNSYFEERLETSDQWIRERTGIESRFFAAADEFTSDLCVKAAQNMIDIYDKDVSDVDFIIVATTTPDIVVPSVASQVQARLQIPHAGAIDLSSACAGFCLGLIMAKGLICAGSHKKILIIGADTLSKVTDFTDRTTCILFGDAAGAVIMEACEEGEENSVYNVITETNGVYGKDLYLTNLNKMINGEEVVANNKLHQNGRTVYKWAIQTLSKGISDLVAKNNLTIDDIAYFLPHSANYRLLEAVFNNMGIDMERCLDSVRKYGNTSAASIPLAYYNGVREGKIKMGDNLLLMGFGGGFTYGGLCIKNNIPYSEKLQNHK